MYSTWKAGEGPKKDNFNISNNPQYRLDIRGTGAVWVLLTRHITDKVNIGRLKRDTKGSIARNCMVFLLPRGQTQSAIYGSQVFDSHKWPTVLVRKVKGKPRNFEANLCGSLYSTFKTSF